MASFNNVAGKRQAEFRKSSETITDGGRSPSDEKGNRFGHLLAHGYEMENLYPSLRGEDGALKFFRERGVTWWQDNANGDITKGKSPTRQMKSSQIACVNFLLPLNEIPGALTAFLKAIDDDVLEVIPINHKNNNSKVEFEWIGEKDVSIEARRTRGSHSTSTDALMLATTKSGKKRAYLIEWKYVEDYSTSGNKSKSGPHRISTYPALYRCNTSSFDPAVPIEELYYDPFDQIMRFMLLADRMVAGHELGVNQAKVVVVVPQSNTAYRERITSKPLARRFPELKTVEKVVRKTLKREDGFRATNYSTLVAAVERECGAATTEWAKYMRERYGD